MRIMPRARCIQYTCSGKTQNVLFFVDNDMNEIISMIARCPVSLSVSLSMIARCPVSLSTITLNARVLASPEISLYAHARIHSHTTHSWNADMPAHAQKKRYRHIYIHNIYTYIYTHRESLVRNHEPRAKALGNDCLYSFLVFIIV